MIYVCFFFLSAPVFGFTEKEEREDSLKFFSPGISIGHLNGALFSNGSAQFRSATGAYISAHFHLHPMVRLSASGGAEFFGDEIFFPAFASLAIRPSQQRRVRLVIDAGYAYAEHDEYHTQRYSWKGGKTGAFGVSWDFPLRNQSALTLSLKYRQQSAKLIYDGYTEKLEDHLNYAMIAITAGIVL